MKQLSDFLHFNDACPVCGKDLSLYVSVSKSTLWKATKLENNTYGFEPHLIKTEEWSDYDRFSLHDLEGGVELKFDTNKLRNTSQTWQFFLFKMCGTEALVDNKRDYDINSYNACYYRSSPWLEFKKDDQKQWKLQLLTPEHKDLVNRDENFTFIKISEDGVEKVYALSLDYENKLTKLWQYSTTSEERALADIDPNIFEKSDLPLLGYRPDFSIEARDDLISQLDGWIIFS